MTRKEKFEQVWKAYKLEASEALEHARVAKEGHRKSDYDFWMQQYEFARERADHFQREFIEA